MTRKNGSIRNSLIAALGAATLACAAPAAARA
jgi:hypothetical protein